MPWDGTQSFVAHDVTISAANPRLAYRIVVVKNGFIASPSLSGMSQEHSLCPYNDIAILSFGNFLKAAYSRLGYKRPAMDIARRAK